MPKGVYKRSTKHLKNLIKQAKGLAVINKGKKHSEEHKRKIGKALMGHKVSEETKEKIGEKSRGRRHSLSIRKRMSRNRKGKGKESKNHRWKGGKYINRDGYVMLKAASHPHVGIRGYVMEHRLIMEKHIGRNLCPEEVVHHINGIKDDNRIENLMLFANNIEHKKFHKENKNVVKTF